VPPPQLLPTLKAHRKAQLAERLLAGPCGTTTTWSSPPRLATPIDRSDDWREWKALLRDAGVHPRRLHDARHTAGTLLVEQDVHIRVVQEILGHARVTTTQRYAHVASPQVGDATSRLGSALWG
jgi:integrase